MIGKVDKPEHYETMRSDKFTRVKEEMKMQEVLHVGKDKIQNILKPTGNSNPYELSKTDMADFRVPVQIFKEYAPIMKGLNKECQDSFLNAFEIDTSYKRSKVSWEKYI